MVAGRETRLRTSFNPGEDVWGYCVDEVGLTGRVRHAREDVLDRR